jgi:diacylglycerol kinase family enzyme
MEFQYTNKRRKRVKLIFNPKSGINDESPVQLMDVIKQMQAWKLVPETYMIEPDCDIPAVVREALEQGIRMFAVCGGDGTISGVTRALVGTNATLGIIPTGTQNNVALSLGIPKDIPAAIAILRTGRRIKVDIGIATLGDISTPFIEVSTVGLLSTLFSSGDDIQHGKITRIGEFLSTLTTSVPSEIHLVLNDKKEIKKMGHAVLISNMPYFGRNYQVACLDCYKDGLLDVLFLDSLSKLDLIGYIIKGAGTDTQEDPNIQRFLARSVLIKTNPQMSVMADGRTIGEGSVRIDVMRRALTLMVGSKTSEELSELGDNLER